MHISIKLVKTIWVIVNFSLTLFPLSLVSHHLNSSFFSFIYQRWMNYGQFLIQNHSSNLFFSFLFIEISDFHIHLVFYFVIFVVLVRRWFVHRLCAALFVFLVSFRYLFGSNCQTSFDPMQIQSMTWTSSTL
jgi:hypothetical protein